MADAIALYAVFSLAWHALQAVPLLIWPQAINGLLSMDEVSGPHPSNPIEDYFARSLGLALLALGTVTVVLSGVLPLGPSGTVDTADGDAPPSPYAAPVILLTTLHHTSSAFYCWARYGSSGQTGFLMGFAGSAVVAAMGTWCVLFGGEKARISRRTGKDKRTSGMLFGNGKKRI
ncbi:hypothetical protein F5Y15DRAFT_94076 [Xylariaceae sp. FL0016]|nr:hypothetical protein F5Y15DRAFT_94076 [Xylariaceae sp. FL0016]